MNRILFHQSEVGDGQVHLATTDRRAEHIAKYLHPKIGSTLRAGIIDGKIGTATIVSLTDGIDLSLTLTAPSLAPWFDLILAMPRPKVLRRLWSELSAIGVGEIYLINAEKVERCYFSNTWLSEDYYKKELINGLEQSGTTILPKVHIRREFRPFVEDEIPTLFSSHEKFIAHPYVKSHTPVLPLHSRPVVAIGPEGGWNDFEFNLLVAQDFTPLTLGPRILRTDTAIIALSGALSGAQI